MNSIKSKEIRKFGIVAFIFFGCLCALGIYTKKPIPTYFFGSLSVIGIGFILVPSHLRPVYAVWMKIAHFLGKVVTTFILVLTYYTVITPAALIKRMFGGRPIAVTFDKKVSSYWVARTEPAQPKERFIKRF